MTEQGLLQLVGMLLTPAVVGYFANRGLIRVAETTVQVAQLNHDQAARSDEAARQVAEVKQALVEQGEAAHARSFVVAANVAEVKRELAASTTEQGGKLKDLAATANQIHGFTNSLYGAALQKVFDAVSRVAALTGLPEDAADVRRAATALADHKAAQAGIDALPAAP